MSRGFYADCDSTSFYVESRQAELSSFAAPISLNVCSASKKAGIQRGTRIPCEIPVTLTSLDPAQPLSDRGLVILVNPQGRWKVIQTVPEIPRLKGERERTFVFTEALRKKYDELAPEPLNSFIQFSCEIGICEGEIIELPKTDVHMMEKADDWGTLRLSLNPERQDRIPQAQPADHRSHQRNPDGVGGEIEV